MSLKNSMLLLLLIEGNWQHQSEHVAWLIGIYLYMWLIGHLHSLLFAMLLFVCSLSIHQVLCTVQHANEHRHSWRAGVPTGRNEIEAQCSTNSAIAPSPQVKCNITFCDIENMITSNEPYIVCILRRVMLILSNSWNATRRIIVGDLPSTLANPNLEGGWVCFEWKRGSVDKQSDHSGRLYTMHPSDGFRFAYECQNFRKSMRCNPSTSVSVV